MPFPPPVFQKAALVYELLYEIKQGLYGCLKKQRRSFMKPLSSVRKNLVIVLFLTMAIFGASPSHINADELLRFSCSDQIYEAFGIDIAKRFSEKYHIKVDVYHTYSRCAMGRLMNGFCDLTAITHRLDYQMKEYGYVEIPFCRDPVAIIVHHDLPITNLTEKQFRAIFNRQITNWNELGGPDMKIILVIPGKNTEMYRNFYSTAMNRQAFQYDYISYKSTMAIEAVRRFEGAISFIARGAVIKKEGITVLNINNISPTSPNYPYYQTFSFVTKGKPEGSAKIFIKAAFSEAGQTIMKERGMVLISDPQTEALLK